MVVIAIGGYTEGSVLDSLWFLDQYCWAEAPAENFPGGGQDFFFIRMKNQFSDFYDSYLWVMADCINNLRVTHLDLKVCHWPKKIVVQKWLNKRKICAMRWTEWKIYFSIFIFEFTQKLTNFEYKSDHISKIRYHKIDFFILFSSLRIFSVNLTTFQHFFLGWHTWCVTVNCKINQS